MSDKSIPIIINTIKSSPTIIRVPADINKSLTKTDIKVLKVSTLKKEVTCYENNSKNVIEIPRSIAKEMGLSNKMKTNLLVRNNKLCLGPVIGVFVSNGRVRKAKKQHPHFRIIEMAKASKEANTILYFFSIKDMDFSNKKIYGTYYNKETGKFEERIFPYPDILYDRGGGTLKSQQKISQDIRKEIEENSKPQKINSRYLFDKWDVYQNLSIYEKMLTYLPNTSLYKNQQDLLNMLQSNSSVYIKDCTSNNSAGVARVKRTSNNAFILSFFNEKIFTNSFSSLDDLQKEIHKLFAEKKIILQAAINVLKVDDCNVDMRAEVQRNEKGELEIGPSFVRIGKRTSPVTSTRAGGTVYLLDDFLKDHLNYPEKIINQIKQKIKTFLLITFNLIEDVYGPFGELGIDFALDKNLNIWFIECNAKPGKDTLYIASDDKTLQRSFSKPLKYGKFLWENK